MESQASTPPSAISLPSLGESSGKETTPGTILTQHSPCAYRHSSIGHEDGFNPGFSLLGSADSINGDDERLAAEVQRPLCNLAARLSAFNLAEPVKLSPTAAPFTPRGQDDTHRGRIEEGQLAMTSKNGCDTSSATQLKSRDPYQSAILVDQKAKPLELGVSKSVVCAEPHYPDAGSKSSSPLPGHTAMGLSHATRYIEISGVPKSLALESLSGALKSKSFNPPSLVIITELVVRGVIYLHFTDIRDSRTAFVQLRLIHPHWRLQFVDKASVVGLHGAKAVVGEDVIDARVVASAVCDGPQHAYDVETVANMVKRFLQAFGDLSDWKVMSANFPRLLIQADYYDTQSVKEVLKSATFTHAGVMISVQGPHFDSARAQVSSSGVNLLTSGNTTTHHGLNERCNAQYSHNSVTAGLHDRAVPSRSESTRRLTPAGGAGPARKMLSNSSQQHGRPVRINRPQSDTSHSQHNVVDVERIRQGLDVRTTVMLRNIPNKINQAMLKEILDETSHSKYDFMYLRIDFANNCNVGYAFINFEDPYYIIDFVKSRAGCRWNRFHSDKVAEVSYATIQGKDCLIQKFRNSSVMMEHPTFRPKIFRTGSGLDAGMEEPFPGPDNTSKMRRSVENAEHVGVHKSIAKNNDADVLSTIEALVKLNWKMPQFVLLRTLCEELRCTRNFEKLGIDVREGYEYHWSLMVLVKNF